MSDDFIDTSVLVRLITRDDPDKFRASAALLRRVEDGELTLRAPDTVFADAVFVLASRRQYNLDRHLIRDALAHFLNMPSLIVNNRRILLRALDIFANSTVDFGDAMIVATMERRKAVTVYSYDRDFDSFPGIVRREP